MYLFYRVIVPFVERASIHTILLSGLFCIFKQNFYGRGAKPVRFRKPIKSRSLELVLRHERLANMQMCFLFFWYITNIIKYTLMILLDLEVFADYRMLDCVLLGRLSFISRSTGAAKYIGLMSLLFFSSCRLFLVWHRPHYNLDYVEFVLNGSETAARNEIRALEMREDDIKHAATRKEQALRNGSIGVIDSLSRLKPAKRPSSSPDDQQTEPDYDPCYITPNYVDMSDDLYHHNLKPNRTVSSWREMNLYSFVFTVFLCIYGVFLMAGVYRISGPTILTNLGFRLNYANCYNWLIEQKRAYNREYPSIRPADRLNMTEISLHKLPFLLPWEDFFEPTAYNLLRVCYDIIENHMMYLDFIITLAVHTANIFHIIFDMCINHKAITRQLIVIIYHLRQASMAPLKDDKRHFSASAPGSSVLNHMIVQAQNQLHMERELEDSIIPTERILCWLTGEPIAGPRPIDRHNCEIEILRIQSVLVDHFVMISRYNKFVNFHVISAMILWVVYTSLLCAWMSLGGSQAVAPEFYVGFMGSFILMIFMLSGPAVLHWCNHKLYKRITLAMALDANVSTTKVRWIRVLKYYFPAPLYCLSLFQSIHLSWFFCLKLYSWVITAILLVGSYLIIYRADPFKLTDVVSIPQL